MKHARHALTLLFAATSLQATSNAQAPMPTQQDTEATRAVEQLRQQYQARYRQSVTLLVIDPDRLHAQPPWMPVQQRYNQLFASAAVDLTDYQARQVHQSVMNYQDPSAYSDMNSGIPHVDLPHGNLYSTATAAFSMGGIKLNQHAGQLFCVVSPAFSDFTILDVPGFGHDRSIRFFNRHEFRHCAQDPNTDSGRPASMAKGLPLHLYNYSVRIMLRETSADLGAASDMIVFDGGDTDFIPHIAHWRADQLKGPGGHDINHYSGLALLALKREIDTMGVEKWREMADSARDAAIERITNSETMNARALRDYLLAAQGKIELPVVAADSTLAGLRGNARDRHNAARHLAVYRAATGASAMRPVQIVLNSAERAALAQWNAVAALEERATALGGSLTADSLRLARVAILDGLRDSVRANPANPLFGAQIIKLDQAYRRILSTRLQPGLGTAAPASAPLPPPARPS